MQIDEQRFNVRVYGVFVNESKEVLLSRESRKGLNFTKFPGGGLEWGEGIKDCIHREIHEELGIKIKVKELLYLTEHFQESAFRKKDQLISVYYLLESDSISSIPNGMKSLDPEELDNSFYWHDLNKIKMETFTFPIDREVFKLLKERV